MSIVFVAASPNQPSTKQLEKGKKLSISCTNCHGTTKKIVAFPIQRIRQYRGKEWAYRIVQNPFKFAAENPKARRLFDNTSWMPSYKLSRAEIDAIYDYLDSLPYDEKEYTHRK
jgi:hypothetical protein